MSKRLVGILKIWSASASGGFGYVDTPSGERFFIHRKYIKSGNPTPGSSAIFTSAPANPGTAYPRAIDVVLNSNTPAARETKIQPKIATDVSSPTAATVSP